jgi:hypothetical protein
MKKKFQVLKHAVNIPLLFFPSNIPKSVGSLSIYLGPELIILGTPHSDDGFTLLKMLVEI